MRAARGAGLPLPPAGTANGTQVFTLTGSGKILHVDGGPVAGEKVFKTTAKLADALGCIAHDPQVGNGSCTEATIPGNETDPAVYLLFDSLTSWRLSVNPEGTDSVELTGLVDSKGGFHMAGTFTYGPPSDGEVHVTSIYLTGKVTFEKGTLVPKKLKGNFSAVSTDQFHYGTGSFKTLPMD